MSARTEFTVCPMCGGRGTGHVWSEARDDRPCIYCEGTGKINVLRLTMRSPFDEPDKLAAIRAELKWLSGVVETLVNAKLTTSQNDADLLRTDMRLGNEMQDVRNKLAQLEYMPRPQMQGYSRSGPAPDWQDGTQSHPKGDDEHA